MSDRLTNLEKKVKQLEQRLSKIEKEKQSTGVQKHYSNIENNIKEKINEIGVQHLIILILKIKTKQTKFQIEETVRKWNKPVGSWFKGGNFNKRLLKKNILMKDGETDSGEVQFALTMKGLREATNLIAKYGL